MTVVAVIMIYPFYFALDAAFRSNSQFISGDGHSLLSWRQLASVLPWRQQLVNSTIVTLSSVAVILVVGSLAGYAIAKIPLRGANVALAAISVALFVPLESIIIPIYANLARVGLLDHYLGAILVYSAIGTPFAVLIMAAFYRRLPIEILEAGYLDGLGDVGVFVRLIIPLSGPVFATVAVLQFIQIWGDLLVGLLILSTPNLRTITVGLGVLASGRTTEIPLLMAGSVISGLPAVIVFLAFQRSFIRGLVVGVER